jgi:Ribosomal RNA adenine dimethylase
MSSDRRIAAHADPDLDQHFLVSAEKLSKLIGAAGIRPTDDVLEVGAGIGTVARRLPKSRSLTVVELDKRLIESLRGNVPHARVLQGDALEIIQKVSFDVLIGSLPNTVTESLIGLMPGLSFRTAILAVGESADLDVLGCEFSWSEVTRISGDDFLPPQPSVSRIVKVVPEAGAMPASGWRRLAGLAVRGRRPCCLARYHHADPWHYDHEATFGKVRVSVSGRRLGDPEPLR